MEGSPGHLRGVDLPAGVLLSEVLGEELAQHRRELEKEWDRLEGPLPERLFVRPAGPGAHRRPEREPRRWAPRDLFG